MSGNRFRFINQMYFVGHQQATPANDAGDEIIADPSSHLLNQADLIDAEGGVATLGLSLGLAALASIAVIGANPRIATHLKQGNLAFLEWFTLGASSTVGYWAGHHAGVFAFGDIHKYQNHWAAYTFVKAQNRYIGRYSLSKAPTF